MSQGVDTRLCLPKTAWPPTSMTNADKKRKAFTFRLNSELSEKVEKEADSLGLSQNSYITMILHKVLRNELKEAK